MKKRFDSVKMMRRIRDELSRAYQDPKVEDRDMARIRRKYRISG